MVELLIIGVTMLTFCLQEQKDVVISCKGKNESIIGSEYSFTDMKKGNVEIGNFRFPPTREHIIIIT